MVNSDDKKESGKEGIVKREEEKVKREMSGK